MRVSHQHRLRKRFSSSGKCNYQRANRTTHHLSMLPINYFSIVRREINHFLPIRAWQCYLTVYSFERMRCATSKESTRECMRTQLSTNTHQHCRFFPPDCLAISHWFKFHHLKTGLIVGNFSLVSSLEYRFNHCSY